MDSETANASHDERDSDDEEVGGNNRLLGFMFGNVDNAGELDVDYLDEDAKEHLDALADQLGQPLTDMDFSGKSSEARITATEEDYDEKAEDAVDYEDIDEQYEGPEVQAATEEDHLLPKGDYLSSAVFTTGQEHVSVFDDDNYDEDEEDEKEHMTVPSFLEVQTAESSDHALHSERNNESKLAHSNLEHEATLPPVVQEDGNLNACEVKDVGLVHIPNEATDYINLNKDDDETLKDVSDAESTNSLPILCVENGMPILRFSEIFGVFEPLTKIEKHEHGYSISRDKFLPPDVSCLVEDDEEEFLRDPSQGYSIISKEVIDDMPITSVDDAEFANFNAEQGCATIYNEGKRDSCLGAEPMKQDLDIVFSPRLPSEMPPNFYPLHYLDWDEQIIWGDSPDMNDNSAENDDFPGNNSEWATNQNKQGIRQTNLQHSLTSRECESSQGQYISLQVTMDDNGTRGSERPADFSYPDCTPSDPDSKPESLNGDSGEHSDTMQENASERNQQTNFLKRFKQLGVRNKEFDEGSWLEKIIWDPEKPVSRSKLIFDLQDDLMIFEISDDSDYKHLQLHAAAMVLSRPAKSAASDYVGLPGLEVLSGGRFNVSNDKFYSTRKASQQLKSVLKKRTAHGVKVWHSIPALKLQTIKPKLSNKEIAYFHRPKAVWYPRDNKIAGKELEKLPNQGPMKIILKSLGGKGTKVYVDTEETVSSVKLKAGKKLDFRSSEAVRIIYSGKELEDDKTLAEQNVLPNSVLHLIRTKIHPFLMAQLIPGENKSLRPPGAFKKKSDLSVKDGHVFLMEYCEERPLLLGNAGMGARLCTYYPKLSSDDPTVDSLRSAGNHLGTVLTLDPADKSPFLGDIKPGSCQSSIETNMYRAPIFPHKVASTDYLLVRSAKGKLSIRRINRMHVVGQQEPHMEVISPAAKGLQNYMMNRLLVHMYREFRDAEKRGHVPCIRAAVLSTLFPNIGEPLLRKRLKHCADLQKRSNGKWLWVKRRNFHIPSEEELRRMVTPENVCSYESMQAGLNRLKRLGITKLYHLAGPTQLASLSSAMNLLPDEAIALAASSHIERELQITPWNLSSNFVACTSQDRENIERLEITGVGDPSGRGLGYSYVRLAAKPPVSNATVKKKPVVAKGSTVTGTDADLRRLSMEAAREVLLKFNVPDEQIAKLTRWHRIAMIRKLSSEQASSGIDTDPMTISKFARGQRMSFLQLQQQTREKCQEIWDRQAESLSAADGDEMESDSEANSDLDSFAGDLENLLDAEECEEMEEDDNMEFKHEKLKMRGHPSQAQLEEEIEDEAAEAAELCQLLIDDAKADGKKPKPKPGSGRLSLQPKGHTADTKLKKNILPKQQIGSTTPSGSFTTHVQNEAETSTKQVLPGTPKDAKTSEQRVKFKPYGEGKILKERKSARERFVCGACHQLGHMRTNKNCPKYREDPDAAPVNTTSQEKAPEKLSSGDPSSQIEPKPKKLITKTVPKSTPADAPVPLSQTEPTKPKKLIATTAPKPTPVDAPDQSSPQIELKPKKLKTAALKPPPADATDGERIIVKPKSLKFKVASKDKAPEKFTPGATVSSEQPSTSEVEPGSKPAHSKPLIVIKPPADTASGKPSVVIKPPADTAKEQPRKKLIFKQRRESTSMDQGRSYDGGVDVDFRKTKKIVDLTEGGVITNRRQDRNISIGGEAAARRKIKENKQRMWEEEERRRMAEKQREETTKRIYMEEMRMREEQERLHELDRYQESIRIEREEEERQKAQKKKKKRKLEPQDDPIEDFRSRRSSNINSSGRLVLERDRGAKRRSAAELARYSNENTPATKRRRGGEVGLANILENIVETLRNRGEVSYLFLKPVSKKEAPDYLDIIERPMDLSTIRDRVRRLEYKNRKEFRHDVWQIVFNAHAYNDMRNPGIPPLADQLLEICDYLLDENDMSLTEAEESIEDM